VQRPYHDAYASSAQSQPGELTLFDGNFIVKVCDRRERASWDTPIGVRKRTPYPVSEQLRSAVDEGRALLIVGSTFGN
jgi:hypothetical protein